MKRILIIIAVLATSLTATAQEETISLRECLSTGLEKNFAIRIARNDSLISHNNATRANAGYYPSIDLNAGYNADLASSSGKMRDTGERQTSHNSLDHNLSAGINLSWTIFDGFNISATYDKLKELERMGETNTRLAMEYFVADMTAEYFNFIQQRRRLDNYYQAVQLSKERLRIVEERYNIGSFSRLDYQQAKVDFNADSAQFIKQQEIVITSRIKLNEMMAVEAVYAPIVTEDKYIKADTTLVFSELWDKMLANNTNLELANQRKRIAELDYKRVKSSDYPYVRLNAGYNYSFSKYDTNSYTRRSNWGGAAGITVGFNLWNGKSESEKRNAKLLIDNAQLEREQTELGLKAELGNLWHAYQNNILLLNLENQNVLTARENHEIAKERYMLGDISGIEMREAQQSMLDAEERLLSVQFQTKMCEISLLLISGEIGNYLK